MESKHTKGNLKVLYGQYPIGTISVNSELTNERVCTLTFDCNIERIKAEANAAHIVKCVNAHDGLVENLARIIDRIKECGFDINFPSAYNRAVECLEKLSDNTPIKQDSHE